MPAAELGESLFADSSLSTSRFNDYACSTCHGVEPGRPLVLPGRFDSGYNLADVAARPNWWGGGSTRLIDAINVCLEEFMGGRRLQPDEPRARQLLEYLSSASPAAVAEPAPLTIVRQPGALELLAGDPGRGAAVYVAGCQRCHGAARAGAAMTDARTPPLPEPVVRMFGAQARHVVVEKVRHGRFFRIGGVMPFYSLEAMSDAQLADLLAFLGL